MYNFERNRPVNPDGTIPVRSWTLSDFLDQVPEAKGCHMWNRSGWPDWDNGVSSPKALELAKTGDTSLVAQALLEVEKYEISTKVQTAFKSEMGYHGTPVIGSYLAGRPDCMRSRTRREVSARHVNIYVGTVCSAAISAENMLRRGAIILGFLETLRNMQIGVDVYLLAEYGRLMVIEIPSRPLDLSVSGFVLAHPAFTRNLIYPWGQFQFQSEMGYVDWTPEKLDASLNDGLKADGRHTQKYLELVRKSLHAEPGDIIIPGPISDSDAILDDPKGWLEKNISQITGENVDAHENY